MPAEDTDDDLVYDDDLDDPETDDSEPEPDPVPTAAEAEPAAVAQASVDALAAVKDSWVELAKVQGAGLADFEGIGMTGVGTEDRQKFIAAARASHEEKVAGLAAMGFVYDPERAGGGPADAEEAATAAAWGEPIAGSGKSVARDEATTARIEEAVAAGNTEGTIRAMLFGEDGLMKFALKKS